MPKYRVTYVFTPENRKEPRSNPQVVEFTSDGMTPEFIIYDALTALELEDIYDETALIDQIDAADQDPDTHGLQAAFYGVTGEFWFDIHTVKPTPAEEPAAGSITEAIVKGPAGEFAMTFDRPVPIGHRFYAVDPVRGECEVIAAAEPIGDQDDDQEPEADPLAVACWSCRAEPGKKCRNYLGKGKPTCKERGTPRPTVTVPAADLFTPATER